MLHTSPVRGPSVRPSDPTSGRVVCRARTWDVLAVRRHDGSLVWHLTRGSDPACTFAAPPDVVHDAASVLRSCTRRAWVRAVCREAASPGVWWPGGVSSLPLASVAYQLVPAMAILSGRHRRVLVADDVGMGKTVQACVLLHEIHARDPDAASLVVVPAGLVDQWVRELRHRARFPPVVMDASAFRRETRLAPTTVDALRRGAVSLVSIDLLRQPEVAALLTRTTWTVLVVDEAHLASPGSARLDAIEQVARVSVRVLLLTATPCASGPMGADALRRIGQRDADPPMLVVRRSGADPGRPSRRVRVLRVRLRGAHFGLCARVDRFADRARLDRGHAGLLPALVLRRRASSSPAALVRSLQRRLLALEVRALPSDTLDLFGAQTPPDQDERDDDVMRLPAWNDALDERRELEALLADAARLPPSGRKLQAVARLVRRCREPVVVFTAFVDTLRALRACLHDVRVVVVHGRQPDALRAAAIAAFTAGEADVLLTTDASAEGLNLHHTCRLVVHVEVPASARSFEQRTGRVDRYGQSRRVHALVLASDTCDDIEALSRLRATTDDATAWLTRTCGNVDRHTALAARLLAGRPDSTANSTAAPHARRCRLAPSRWHRLARRLELPAHATSLVVGEARLHSDVPLTASRVVLAMATIAGVPSAATWPAAAWRFALRRHMRRSERLVRRLWAWQQGAELACHAVRLAQAPAPGLFDDAAPSDRPTPAHARECVVHVSVGVTALLEPRS